MALDVKVKIDLLKPVGELGFGYPLILKCGADKAIDYTVCMSLDDLTADLAIEKTDDIYTAAELMMKQNDSPEKFAVCATTEAVSVALPKLLGKDWRQLVLISEETDYSTVVSEIIEDTVDKMYFATVATAPTTDKNYKNYKRTVAFVYGTQDDYAKVAVAALVGATAGYKPGSFTYKNIILNGLTAQSFTDMEIRTMHENGAISVVSKAGDNVTTEGIVGTGEYIDIIDSMDWLVQQLEYRTQKLLNKEKKIPYDNRGIAQLESVAVDVLKTAFNNGMIAVDDDGNPAYTVNYALRAECDPNDIASRKYVGGKFAFILAGAVHNVEINGEISVA